MDGLWSSLQVNHDTENIDFNSEIDFSTDRLVGQLVAYLFSHLYLKIYNDIDYLNV